MDGQLARILEKQHYKVVGEHSGVKLCHWMRQRLLYGRPCYKQLFYGIETHRCLQMTPTINQCTQSCLFCWRFQGFSETALPRERADEPEKVLDDAIAAQWDLVSGFKGDPRCDERMWREATEPRQVAISLSGEPTLYPYLGDLIGLCHKRGMTTFVVSNGTVPDALAELDPLPTQLYVTVAAPDEEVFKKLCVPMVPDAWEKLGQTLELLPSLDTRTVIRHTLVDGWNLGWEKEYARLDSIADPMFIEPKGYVFVGYSRKRMTIKQMPSFERVRGFGETLGRELGMEIVAEQAPSRVVALGRDEKELKIRG